MRKPLLIAFFLGFVAFKAEAQSSNRFRVDTVVLAAKTPPKYWFGTQDERAMAEALLKISSEIHDTRDGRRGQSARSGIAMSLARLGYEKEARALIKYPTGQTKITKFMAIRAVLDGREDDAIELLPKLDEFDRVQLQTLIGNAFLVWKNDKVSARKWLLEVHNYYSKTDPNGSLLELEIATDLAKAGAIDEAKTIFKTLDGSWRPPKFDEAYSYIYRSALFDARLHSGLENDAMAMLKNNRILTSLAIQALFSSGKDAQALALLNRETPVQAFAMLHEFSGSPRNETPTRTEYSALLSFWKRLPVTRKNQVSVAEDMTVLVANLESVGAAYSFIRQNFKGQVAQQATRSLKGEILKNGELQKAVAPKTLQEWREEAFRSEEAKMKKSLTEPRGFFGAEYDAENWMAVYRAAMAAKKFGSAKLALEQSEKAAAKNKGNNPIYYALKRREEWLKFGDKKRAEQNLTLAKSEAAKLTQTMDATNFYDVIFPYPDVMQEIFMKHPPRDLMVISEFVGRGTRGDEKTLIPAWILKIPDAPTRAAALSSRADLLWPIDEVKIQLN